MFEAEQKSLSTWERHWTGPEIDWTRRSDSTAWSKTERWVKDRSAVPDGGELGYTHFLLYQDTSKIILLHRFLLLFSLSCRSPRWSIYFIYFFVMLPLLLLFCFVCLTFQLFRLYSSQDVSMNSVNNKKNLLWILLIVEFYVGVCCCRRWCQWSVCTWVSVLQPICKLWNLYASQSVVLSWNQTETIIC